MKLDAKFTNMHYDFEKKGTVLEFLTYGNILPMLEENFGTNINEVSLEIKKQDKRSNNANAYLWTLLGELQRKLRTPKEELYRKYIRECGTYQVLPVRNDAVERFIVDVWAKNGLGWVCDTTPSKIDGYTNVIAYYGTSVYTREEMAVLLDNVIEDCVELKIPTKPKEEIDTLLRKMEGV